MQFAKADFGIIVGVGNGLPQLIGGRRCNLAGVVHAAAMRPKMKKRGMSRAILRTTVAMLSSLWLRAERAGALTSRAAALRSMAVG